MPQEMNIGLRIADCGIVRKADRRRGEPSWVIGFWVPMMLAILAVFPGQVIAAMGEPRLLIVHGFVDELPVQRGIERFREVLTGMVSVETSTRWDDRETLRAVLAGEVDAAVVSPAALRDIARETTLLDLIGLWRDRAHWVRAVDGEPGRQFLSFVERPLRPGADGLRLLGYWGGTRLHLLTRREGVATVEALAALRLGVPLQPVRSKFWKALGVRTVLLPGAESAAALRDGSVEAIEEEAGSILRERLFEAARHLTETGHAIATRLFLVAPAAWARLSRSQRAAVTAAAREATAVARNEEARLEAQALVSLRDQFAVTLHEFIGRDALMARTRSLRHRYADELGVRRLLTLIEQLAKP